MEPKEFIQKEVEGGKSQTEIANKVGVSNATIYKILYTNTKLTLETIRKIAAAYHKPLSYFIADEEPVWHTQQAPTDSEKRLLAAFRSLDDRRQERILDTIEDMVLALRESGDRESPAKDSEDSNLKRNSNG